MAPPFDHPSLRLFLLPRPFYVVQLPVGDKVPDDLLNILLNSSSNCFLSVTRTDEELSIVGESDPSAELRPQREAKWRCIKIAGPMDFGITGVMCDLSAPLKAAGIPIFAVSTWNTDYILVPREKVAEAVKALKEDGWSFSSG